MNKEIKLYGVIGPGEINSLDFSSQLVKLEQEGCKNLTIHMHCFGGSVFEGNVIYNTIKSSKISIKIIVDGIAASMASILLLAVEDVAIAENGFVMVHRPSSELVGDADQHLSSVKLLQDMENNFIKSISLRTKLPENDVKNKWFDGKDHWLNADEAIQYGFANSKVDSIAKDIKTLNKEKFSSMDIKNIYDKYKSILTNQNNVFEMKKELIDLFGLEGLTEQSSDTAIIKSIKAKVLEMQKSAEDGKKQVETSVKNMVQDALNTGKIDMKLFDTYLSIGMTSGIDSLSKILSGIQPRMSIVDKINAVSSASYCSDEKPKHEWTLDDYRMKAPNELKDNPELYNKLCEKQFGKQ